MDIKERIRLSIDLVLHNFEAYRSSMVDIQGDRISFFFVSEEGIKRYDVTGWDDENIHCKFGIERTFTILERMLSSYNNHTFVKDGLLYNYTNNKLMAFDIRDAKRIRKLGHFVRTDFRIEDIAVLENGNILMCSRYYYEIGNKDIDRSYLYLLKDPR